MSHRCAELPKSLTDAETPSVAELEGVATQGYSSSSSELEVPTNALLAF